MCSNVKRKYSNVGGGKLLVTCRNKLYNAIWHNVYINCKFLERNFIYIKLNIYNQLKFSDQVKKIVLLSDKKKKK